MLKSLLIDMRLNNIALSDCRILSTIFDAAKKILVIESEGSFLIEEQISVSKTTITFRNWTNFDVMKFVSVSPFSESYKIVIDIEKDFEQFEFIQELEIEDNCISMRGFSKTSGEWLIYELLGCE